MQSPDIDLVSAHETRSLSALTLLVPLAGEFVAGRASTGRARLRPGDLLVVRAERAISVGGAMRDAEALCWTAAPEWPDQILPPTIGTAGLRFGAQAGASEGVLVEPGGSDLAKRASRLMSSGWVDRQRKAQPSSIQELRRNLDLLEVVFAARTPAFHAATGTRAGTRRRADLVRALADMDPSDPEWSLAALATRLMVSERHASRLFQLETGVSFRTYTTAARLERAKKLLVSTNNAITEVGFLSGWGALSQFHDVFRRKTGLTPGAYRAAYRTARRKARPKGEG